MDFPVSEHLPLRQKGRVRPLERVGETKSQHEAADDGEPAHEHEQPKPSSLPTDTAHVQDTVGEEFGRRLAELVAEVEDHDAFGCLRAGVPCRQCPQPAWDEAGFSNAQEEASCDERAVATLPGLKCADGAEEE